MDMTTFSPALPIFLLLAALAIGVWQLFSAGGATASRSTRADLASGGEPLTRVDPLRVDPLRVDPQPSYR